MLGIKVSTATVQNSTAVPQKTGSRATIQPRNPTLGIYTPKGNQVSTSKRHLYSHVYSSTVHNSPDMESTYMSTNKQPVAKMLKGTLTIKKGMKSCPFQHRWAQEDKHSIISLTWNLKGDLIKD